MPLDQQFDIESYEVLNNKGKEMSFLDHLEELRWHLIRTMGVAVIMTLVMFAAKDFVFGTVLYGPRRDDFLSYRLLCWLSETCGLGERLCMTPYKFELQTIEFGEAFLLHLKVSFILGMVLTIPYLFWEIWRFVKAGLFHHEQRSTRNLVWIGSGLFITGACFGYFVISPFAVNFLASYTLPKLDGSTMQEFFKVSSYVDYMVMFTVPIGFVFELPLIVYFLAKLDLITGEFMRNYRRHAFVLILLLAALITPPDVLTQFLIGVPLYVLYELSINIAKRMETRVSTCIQGVYNLNLNLGKENIFLGELYLDEEYNYSFNFKKGYQPQAGIQLPLLTKTNQGRYILDYPLKRIDENTPLAALEDKTTVAKIQFVSNENKLVCEYFIKYSRTNRNFYFHTGFNRDILMWNMEKKIK